MYRPEIDKTQRDRCYTCQGSGKTWAEHDRAWEKEFVVPIAREMKQRGVGYMVICIRDNGKAAYVLEPGTPDDATVGALIRQPNAEVSDRRAHDNDNTTGANGGSLH
jgi:hypothetical protein